MSPIPSGSCHNEKQPWCEELLQNVHQSIQIWKTKTWHNIRHFPLNSNEMTEISGLLTCTFLNLCWELPVLVLLRQCSLQGTSRVSELQRRWRRTLVGWGYLSCWPGILRQYFGLLLGKLETAYKAYSDLEAIYLQISQMNKYQNLQITYLWGGLYQYSDQRRLE